MGVAIVQVNFNDSSDRTLTGVSTFDRASGGVLIPPNGTTFPLVPVVGELFWRTDLSRLYRWDGSQWNSETADADLSGSTTDDLAEGTTNLYYTEARVSANTDVALNTTHRGLTNNPHSVTKTQVGLGSVTDDAQLKRAAADFATFTEKASPVSADILLIEDSAAAGVKKKVSVGNLPGGTPAVFGAQFQQTSKSGDESVTGTTWTSYLSFTTGTLPAGTYRIGFWYQWTINTIMHNFESRLLVGGVEVFTHVQEPADAQPAQRNIIAAFVYEVVASSGTRSIVIEYRSAQLGNTAIVKAAAIEVWRVS